MRFITPSFTSNAFGLLELNAVTLTRMAEYASVILAILCVLLPGSSLGQPSQASNPDRALRSPEIHWPAGRTPEDADLFVHNELVVHASCSLVWEHLVEVSSWPEWYPNSHNVKMLNSPDGRLHRDTRFSWNTFGVHVNSRIHEFVPKSRVCWFGDGSGIQAYHTFLLLKAPAGCQIVAEEVVKGTGAVELRRKDPEVMHRGYDLWLASLKKVSEE